MKIYQRIFEACPDGLLVVDAAGTIAEANPQAESLFGYQPGTLVGQPVETLIPNRHASRHIANRSEYFKTPRPRPMGGGLDLFGRRHDDSEFPVDIMLSPLSEAPDFKVLCVVRDVSDRRRAEQLVLDSLREKEVLLKEIHHRVKNNLAVISSLFYLQSTYVQDERMAKIMQESQDRVRSMALVHESLYGSDNLAEVDFAEYARNLSSRLVSAYSLSARQILLTTELESVNLNIDVAVPLGLILNEIVTNAVKHAFPDGREGRILLRLSRCDDGICTLEVNDNGVGIPADFDSDTASSLGVRLIRSLTRQIDGAFEFRPSNPGTSACLTLRLQQTEGAVND